VSRAPQPSRQQQRTRRQKWIKIVSAFLVLAMLAPVIIAAFL